MGRAHPPADISLDGLAVTTHRSVPSGPLVNELDGMEKRHLSWQRGYSNSFHSYKYFGRIKVLDESDRFNVKTYGVTIGIQIIGRVICG